MDVSYTLTPAERTVNNDNYSLKVEACATCRFWAPDAQGVPEGPKDAGFGFGLCRRHSPTVNAALADIFATRPQVGRQFDPEDVFSISDHQRATVFPGTFMTTWCGEFEWLPRLQPFEMPV